MNAMAVSMLAWRLNIGENDYVSTDTFSFFSILSPSRIPATLNWSSTVEDVLGQLPTKTLKKRRKTTKEWGKTKLILNKKLNMNTTSPTPEPTEPPPPPPPPP